MTKKILISAGLFTLFLVLIALSVVPVVPEEKAKTVNGKVIRIFEGGEKDIVFVLEGNSTSFYINRGLESGLDLMTLQSTLLGEEVSMKYPKHWTPLDWNNSTKHLAKLEYQGEVLYNEFKD